MSPTVIPTTHDFSHIKMVASDLDGTLIVGKNYRNGQMSDRTIASLQALENKGIPICMASGRPPRSMFPLVAQAKLKHPYIISCNGGLLLDNQTKQIIRKYSLSTEAVRELIKCVKEHFGPDDILVGGESGTSFRCEEAYAQKRFDWVGKVYIRVDDLNDLANDDNSIEKLMLLHRVWTADILFEYLKKNVLTDPKWKEMIHYTFSSPYFVEVSGVGVNKATALKGLCEELGVESKDLIAFGDMPNDCEMLEFAGVGVAMGNAHQQTKDSADIISANNYDDGVAVVLEQVFEQI